MGQWLIWKLRDEKEKFKQYPHCQKVAIKNKALFFYLFYLFHCHHPLHICSSRGPHVLTWPFSIIIDALFSKVNRGFLLPVLPTAALFSSFFFAILSSFVLSTFGHGDILHSTCGFDSCPNTNRTTCHSAALFSFRSDIKPSQHRLSDLFKETL